MSACYRVLVASNYYREMNWALQSHCGSGCLLYLLFTYCFISTYIWLILANSAARMIVHWYPVSLAMWNPESRTTIPLSPTMISSKTGTWVKLLMQSCRLCVIRFKVYTVRVAYALVKATDISWQFENYLCHCYDFWNKRLFEITVNFKIEKI